MIHLPVDNSQAGVALMRLAMRNNLFFLIIFTLIIHSVSAQSNRFQSLGNLESYQSAPNGLNLKTSLGKAEVTVYSEGIIRIRIVKDNFTEPFSYAVVMKPEKLKTEFKETSDKLTLSTGLIRVEISRSPVRFAFYTVDGQLLNTDDPALGTSWLGTEVTTCKTLQPGERFIGLGEKTGNLDRFGSAYTNWNTDNPRYGTQDDPLYVSIPFYIGLHHGQAYGIFLDNSYKSLFNFGAGTNRFSSFSADDGEMDYYFIHQPNVKGIIRDYTALTGRMTMPPLWALGYQQCRWSYYPDSKVIDIVENFRLRKIPIDVIYLDIHYMDNYKIFTWHPQRFPEPAKMLSKLKAMGVHTTVIVDPGIRVEKGYAAFEDGVKKDMFIKYPDESIYTAQVWPGWCYFPDFTKPSAREWWGNNFKGLVDAGVDGFWNDMNEIASWGGGYTPNFIGFDWEGHHSTYRQAKNVYGFQMSKATSEGTRKLMQNRRPLVLTRAGYAGLQRYTALWTGDNQATDEHMMLGARLLNSLGLSGVSFTGVDVGGFSQNATPELFARWISIGAFSPFFRSHSAIDTRQAEPWAFGETVETISRNYISLRYKLLPYIYSTFHESVESGMPVNRSLAIDYTFDENIYNPDFQQEYLFGPNLLVAPIESTKNLTPVYLPEGEWYNFHTDELHTGNSITISSCPIYLLPLFVKAGSIIPMQLQVQHTGEDAGDTLFLHVYNGRQTTIFNYYEDDGNTYNYEKGQFYSREMIFDAETKTLTLKEVQGSYKSKFSNIVAVLHGFGGDLEFSMNGSSIHTQDEDLNLLDALSSVDAAFTASHSESVKVKRTNALMIVNNEMVISWK
jgi:alpha-glucosidase